MYKDVKFMQWNLGAVAALGFEISWATSHSPRRRARHLSAPCSSVAAGCAGYGPRCGAECSCRFASP
ncbi:hypothetical protein AK812_SmicGene22560 [Symbiodinium microadriaticum]|uniref:Uncharacterized protein n=1 Tax=Symbiodinium microadriaticum TaxID=2951 RepID=A0A1Q9DJH4_SYMMI|nr:hypothetical protein AK812_SmicGene22560 [Symbiodinium microadriaticum]